ncbi:MAG: hypothetical protein LQ346_005333 [Caloplaca aetnensis]|nr:MAG: hypothetical protein LQ346_005333 [Caloplaca aetnensis]
MSPQQQQMLTPSLSATSDLAAQFALLRDLIPTVQQLADLRKAIDQECLAHTEDCPTRNPALSSGTVVEIALYLSSSLVQWQGTASDVSWDVQLRALVAALALLLHQGARNLTAEPHESLRRNIAARFNDIVNFSTSSLEDRMSKVNAFYLIRLINQYFSLFKRAQPLSDALPLPVIGLVMAGASMVSPPVPCSPQSHRYQAGGQYNGLRSIFQYADEVIGLIPGRKNRYLNLPAIQEITRRATTMMDVTSRAQNHIHAPEIAADATSDVNLVQELLDTHFQDIPSKRSDQWNWPLARLRLGPPLMNKWGFFYGLLDCAAQLARYHGPEQLSPTLLRNLEQLLAESEFEEFRWKVREITTSFNEQSTSPSALAEAQWASEKTSSGTTSAPSLGVGLSPATTVDPDVIQPCTQEGDSMTGHCTEMRAVPLVSERTADLA